MIGHHHIFGVPTVLGLGAAAPVLVTGMAFTDDHIALVVAIATGIGSVVGAMAFIEARMRKLIEAHADEEQRLDEERHARTLAEIRVLLAERDHHL